jgi:hypothetical protein
VVRTGSLRTQSARHRVDHGTICGRSCANSGHYKPLCACVDRTFVKSKIRRAGVQKKFGLLPQSRRTRPGSQDPGRSVSPIRLRQRSSRRWASGKRDAPYFLVIIAPIASERPSYRFSGLMQHDRGLPKALPRCPQDGGLPSACDSRKVTGRVSAVRRTGLRLAATTVKAIPAVSPGQRKGGSVSASPAKRSLGCSERCIRNLAARQG